MRQLQGVSWDPASEFVVSQSTDRTCRYSATALLSSPGTVMLQSTQMMILLECCQLGCEAPNDTVCRLIFCLHPKQQINHTVCGFIPPLHAQSYHMHCCGIYWCPSVDCCVLDSCCVCSQSVWSQRSSVGQEEGQEESGCQQCENGFGHAMPARALQTGHASIRWQLAFSSSHAPCPFCHFNQ